MLCYLWDVTLASKPSYFWVILFSNNSLRLLLNRAFLPLNKANIIFFSEIVVLRNGKVWQLCVGKYWFHRMQIWENNDFDCQYNISSNLKWKMWLKLFFIICIFKMLNSWIVLLYFICKTSMAIGIFHFALMFFSSLEQSFAHKIGF